MNPIVKEAYTWLGTPHVNQAKVKGKGVDCGMLLIACLEDAGYVPKGTIKVETYSNEWHLHHSSEWFLHIVERYCDKVDDLQEGDFLLYRYGRCVSHGAIYVGGGYVIHALVEQGVVMSDIDDVMFVDKHGKSRLYGIYRFRKEAQDGNISKP